MRGERTGDVVVHGALEPEVTTVSLFCDFVAKYLIHSPPQASNNPV